MTTTHVSSPPHTRTVLALVCALVASVLVTGAPAHAADANADFVGHWTSGGPGWAITSEDASGACAGTSDYGDGYTLTNCKVTGSSYAFDIDYSDWYVSKNTGTISGDTATGGFVDNSGHSASYTAYRTGVTATTLSCPTTSSGIFTCTARVTDSTAPGDTPTGTVSFSTTGGTLETSSCTLKAGSCTFTYTPTARSNESTTTLTGSYLSDQPLRFGNSSGTRSIKPITMTVGNKAVKTYIAFAQTAEFTLTLSRPSNVPVSVHAATADGTGKYAAKAHDADYKRLDRTVTLAAGKTRSTVGVTVFPREDIRVDSNFRLQLTELHGATFAAAPSAMVAGRQPRETPPASYVGSKTVRETIDPHLLAGTVEEAVDITDHKKAPQLWVRRWDSKTFIPLRRGTNLYVGDEIMTHKNTVAALHFVIGGEVGINGGTRATVVSSRSVREGDGGALSIIKHKIHILVELNHEKAQKMLIQTNGGVLGIKG